MNIVDINQVWPSCYLLKMKLLISTKYDIVATYWRWNCWYQQIWHSCIYWRWNCWYQPNKTISTEDVVNINQIWPSCYLWRWNCWYQPNMTSCYLLKMKLVDINQIWLSCYLLKMKLLISTKYDLVAIYWRWNCWYHPMT